MRLLEESEFDFLIIDLDLARYDENSILDKAHIISPRTFIILTTTNASVETAVGAFRKGAIDYLIKPLNQRVLLDQINQAIQLREILNENRFLRREIHNQKNPDQLRRSPQLNTFII